MIKKMRRYGIIVAACLLVLGVALGCDTKEKTAQTAKPVMAPGPADTAAPTDAAAPVQPLVSVEKADDGAIAIEVDGVKMMKARLNAEVEQKLASLRGQIPPENMDQAKGQIRKGLVDEFVLRTLLAKEIAARKVTATDKEIADMLDSVKGQLPPGQTLEEVLKKNGIDMAAMREEIGMNIKINKLVLRELGEKGKVTEKEIADYYEKNKEKFTKPETVHARHLLVAKVPEETDKTREEKRKKAEELRKKLLAGADFAELAAKSSDCPSKQNGGDLGTFPRGQMVKPFEDAVFSQQKNAIGPVVETEFGFHIIQVIDRQAAQVVALDGDTKRGITALLDRQKQQGAFEGMMKRLKAKANILVYGK